MVAPLEAPHTLPSASHLRPLPFYKQSAPVSPLFASLAKSAHRVHSTPLSRPLFSTTCALFCTNENAMSFAFNRLRTLCAKHGGCGCSVCVFSSIFSASSRGWVSAISCGMNTYEKTGEGGRGRWHAAISAQRFRGCLLPRLKPAASRTSNPATPAAHPSAHSTAGSDPSSYEQCDARAIPTPRASGTRPCHPRRDADRIAGSRLPFASAPPAREAPPRETAHARCARASTQSASRHSSAASRDDSPRSLSASFCFFGKPSLLSSLPSRRDCTPKVAAGKQYYIWTVSLNFLVVTQRGSGFVLTNPELNRSKIQANPPPWAGEKKS